MSRALRGGSLLLVTLLTVGIYGCSPFKVRTEVEPGVDLRAARTYAWAPGMQEAIDESTSPSLFREAIDAELQRKGFVLERERTPDFFVSFRFQSDYRVEQHIAREYPSQDTGWFPSIGGSAYLDESRTSELRILVYDQTAKRQIWRGFATGEVPVDLAPSERKTVVRSAVDAALSRFPPG